MPKINESYFRGDYPREGCQLIVDVLQGGYGVTVLAPLNAGPPDGTGVLERHMATSSEELRQYIDEWRSAGKELPPPLDEPCEVMQRPPYEAERRVSACKQWPDCAGCENPARKQV